MLFHSAIVASKTDEGIDVAHHFASPLVLRSLVDRLASYRAPAVTGTSEGNNRVGKYGFTPGASSPAPVAEAVEDVPPPPTLTEDLVIKLLACLMVHPQQGQRARLVLRDEVPEALYMALHQAGSVPADIKGDSATALPPLPHRDTDHKLYPKKGNAGAGAAGAEPEGATGGAKAPESLARPLSILVTPEEEETTPVTVENVEGNGIPEEVSVPPCAASEASPSPRRESLRRTVVSALTPGRSSESRVSSFAGRSAGGGPSPSRTPSGRGTMWQRASKSWAKSALNPANGGAEYKVTSGTVTVDVVEEDRPVTLPAPSPQASEMSRSKAISLRKLSTRLAPPRASSSSPVVGGSAKGRSVMGWGTISVASNSNSPKPTSC